MNGVNPVTKAIQAGAAVARLILNENPLTGGKYSSDFDKDLSGITVLFDTLKTSSVTELGLAKCRLGPGSLGKLAEYVSEATAAIARLDLSGNMALVVEKPEKLLELVHFENGLSAAAVPAPASTNADK